jgi:esterase/lipase superfamily enzyme
MHLRLLVLLFFVGAFLTAENSYAQPSAFDAVVKQSLRLLIAELQTKIKRQSVDERSALTPTEQSNPALNDLGEPTEIFLSSPAVAQGLFNFNAEVSHVHGLSEWTVSVLETGSIVSYEFKISGPFTARDVSPAAPAVDPRVVEFLFASTRRSVERAPGEDVAYGGERGHLSFGAASVRIPDDHKIGRIELPSSWRLFGITLQSASNDHEHFIIKRVASLSEDAFGQVIRGKNARNALIFVHGFNTSFEDALYRNAQIIWDLQYNGLSVLFTWASRGELTNYLYDKESAQLARGPFISLLKKLKRDYGIEEVNVLAHSMGNLIALDALANDTQTSDPVKIAHLVMAAPDVDRDQFRALTSEAKSIVGNMTLYASSADRAMTLSRRLAGGIPRAGDVTAEGPIVLPTLETIDVSAMGEEIFGLNHSVFASQRDVMEDIAAMLKFNLPSPRLIQIRSVPNPPAAPQYWRFVR